MASDGTAPVKTLRGLLLEPDVDGAMRLRGVLQAAFPAIETRVAHNADQARKLLADLSPDVAVVDSAFGGIVAEVAQRAPQCCLIVCAGHISDDRIFAALKAGATGYVLKHDSASGLAEEIRAIREGARPMSAGMARKILQHFSESLGDGLNPGELRVLEGIASGATQHALTSRLGIAIGDRIRTIYGKLARKAP